MFCCINVIFGAKLIIIWNLIYCFAAFLGAIVFWFDLNPDHPGINNFDIFALLPKHNAIWYIKHRKTAGFFFGFIFTMNSGMMIYWFFVGVMCLKTKFNWIYTERFFFSYFTQEAFTMIYSFIAVCIFMKLNLVEFLFMISYQYLINLHLISVIYSLLIERQTQEQNKWKTTIRYWKSLDKEGDPPCPVCNF